MTDNNNNDNSLTRHFGGLPDPPRDQGKRHKLTDLLVIAVCAVVTAVICAADSGSDVVDFARAKAEWFGTFLDLPHGIPSHDTFERVFAWVFAWVLAWVFARPDPDAFERCFMAWTAELAGTGPGKLLAIDGKAIRRSFTRAWQRSGCMHLVSVFASAEATVLGQLALEAKENELPALRKLLGLLDLKDATVTIDAMGCQKDIAAKITDADGDYVPAVKDNQPTLHAALRRNLDELILDELILDPNLRRSVRHGHAEQTDAHGRQSHGRVETRRVWVTDQSPINSTGWTARSTATTGRAWRAWRWWKRPDRTWATPPARSAPWSYTNPTHFSCVSHAVAVIDFRRSGVSLFQLALHA